MSSAVEMLAGIITRTPILAVDKADHMARHAYARAILAWRQEAAQALAAIDPPARHTRQGPPAPKHCAPAHEARRLVGLPKGGGGAKLEGIGPLQPQLVPRADILRAQPDFRIQVGPVR